MIPIKFKECPGEILDLGKIWTEKRSPELTEVRSPKTNIRIYSNSYTEYSNTIFSIRSHPYRELLIYNKIMFPLQINLLQIAHFKNTAVFLFLIFFFFLKFFPNMIDTIPWSPEEKTS